MNRRELLLLGLMICFTLALLWPTLSRVTFVQSGGDEGFYLHYASRIAQEGLRAFPRLFQEYRANIATWQYFPSPTRVLTILFGAASVRLTGAVFGSLQALSLVSFLALLVVVYLGLRRSAGLRVAVWTTLLLCVSPLHLAMARRALADSFIATLAVVYVFLFLRALEAGPRALRAWGLAAAALLAALLAREGAAALIPISLILVILLGGRTTLKPWPVCAVSVVPLAAAAAVIILAAGGAAPAWHVLSASVASPATNSYAIHYGSGPWFRYVLDFLLISPWSTLLYLLWLGCCVVDPPKNKTIIGWTLLPVLFVVCAACLTKNVRYALLLETPIRLGAILLLQRAIPARWGDWKKQGALGFAILALMWFDLQTFHHLFLEDEIYDPVTVLLLRARHLLPR